MCRESVRPSVIPSIVRELSGEEEARLVWVNERGGLTFRVGNHSVPKRPDERPAAYAEVKRRLRPSAGPAC